MPIEISMVSIPADLRFAGDPQALVSRIRTQMERVMLDEARIVQNMYNGITTTWNERPNFSITVDFSGDQWLVQVYTEDRIFEYLDNGTSIRYATMEPGFRPKTRPNSLRSGQGVGGVAYVSRRFPRPGIEARNWSAEITRRRDGPFQSKFERVVNTEVDRYWRSLFGR